MFLISKVFFCNKTAVIILNYFNVYEVEAMFSFFICFIAGIGAGLGTGFADMNAATLNRATGVVLVVLGAAILGVKYIG